MKERKDKFLEKTVFITTLLCLLPMVVGLALYNRFPEQMVTHWDATGTPNGYSSKFVAIFVLPGSLALLNMLMPFFMKMDPKYQNMGEKLKMLVVWIIPMVALFASGSTMAYGLGIDVPIPALGTALVGFVLVLIGNYLPKTKQSYTLGIKLPWTLYDEENWNKTHRLAGFLWVGCGLLILISSLFSWRNYVLPISMILMIAVPTVYSYWIYKKNLS